MVRLSIHRKINQIIEATAKTDETLNSNNHRLHDDLGTIDAGVENSNRQAAA